MEAEVKKVWKIGVLALAYALFETPSVASDKPFVVVNGTRVSQQTADYLMTQQKAAGPVNEAEARAAVREELVKRELLLQEAKKNGYDKDPIVVAKTTETKRKLQTEAELTSQTIVVRAFVQDYLQRNAISDAQLKTEYGRMKADGNGTEYKVRHILLRTEQDARNLLVRFKHGAKFEDLCKESIDPSSRSSMCDLGWATPPRFEKPFSDAITRLKKGTSTDSAVKTEAGYHLIWLDDTRPFTPPTFEQMKPLLLRQAQEEAINKLTASLRTKASIE